MDDEIENLVLSILAKVDNLDTLEIAKLAFGPRATQKMINPMLYKMLKDGTLEKIVEEGVARPRWKLTG